MWQGVDSLKGDSVVAIMEATGDTLHHIGMTDVLPLSPLLAMLGLLLAVALMVERLMAALSWLIDKLVSVKKSVEWSPPSLASEDLMKAVPVSEKVETKSTDTREVEFNTQSNLIDSRFDFKPATLPDEIKVSKEFWTQLVGCLIAIAGCYYSKLSAWSLIEWPTRVLQQLPATLTNAPLQLAPRTIEYIFTGIIIGAGSKPVNFLIKYLLNRKVILTRKSVSEPVQEIQPPVTPVKEKSDVLVVKEEHLLPGQTLIEKEVGFVYDGGDRPERLQMLHVRPKNSVINLLVYHHTTMHCDAPFEEVVKEFDRKGWLTGYHCVVFKDGTIRVLCRWDRYGNHVQGHNTRSLGVAFQGCFDTNKNVPFSNWDGRFGMDKPTTEQLHAAARVTALWALMHNIPMIFSEKDNPDRKGILPHNILNSGKACPGNNFPYAKFQQKVKEYAEAWQGRGEIIESINELKIKIESPATHFKRSVYA